MGKASRKKRSAEDVAPPSRAPAPLSPPPAWTRPLLLVASAAGIALGATSTWIRHQVTTSGGAYASFCNLGEGVDCDSVVTSAWGSLFGVPVSVWAIGFYVLLGAVALRTRAADHRIRDRARADVLGLAAAGAAFSLYMAAVSVFVLGTVCVLCVGLYVVSAIALVAAAAHAAPLRDGLARLGERGRQAWRRPVLSSSLAAAAVFVLVLPAWLGAPTLLTRDEIFRKDPEFFDWYTNQPVVDAPAAGGHARGPEDAPIQLVEFSDFECPHCRSAHVTLKDLLSRYRDEVRFVFRHFPLSSLCNPEIQSVGHENACAAAVASECAGEQGKFDAYANLLFRNQGDLSPERLRALAEDLGLDGDAFGTCLEGPAAKGRVQADIGRAREAGVRSTPTFFLNGRRLEGNLTYERWLLAFGLELDRS